MGRASRGKKNRTTDNTPGTRVLIAVTPRAHADDPARLDLRDELRMLRSSLLYADHVDMMAPSLSMTRELIPLVDLDADSVLHRMGPLPPATLVKLGIPSAEVTDFKVTLRTARRKKSGHRLREYVEEQFRPVAEDVRSQAQQLMTPEQAEALELVQRTKALRLIGDDTFTVEGDDTDAQIDWFIEQITQGLASPTAALMLDPTTAALIHDEKVLTFRSQASDDKSRRAQVGTGLIERLPTFPDAPMRDVLEARAELADGRGKYRAAVKTLASAFEAHALEPELPVEIDEVWHEVVQPALADMRSTVSGTRLFYEGTKKASVDQIPATLSVGVTALVGGHSALTAAQLAGSATAIVAKGVQEAFTKRAETQTHELVYLSDLDRKLGAPSSR